MSALGWFLLAAAALSVALFLLPRLLIVGAQNRIAKRTMARDGRALKLLTRADLVTGRYKRIPGLLAWRDDVLSFQGIAGHSVTIPPARIQKIVTADRMTSGRLFVKLEVLRLTDTDGEELEFVLARDTADAWRRLLGEWAARERQAPAGDLVIPPPVIPRAEEGRPVIPRAEEGAPVIPRAEEGRPVIPRAEEGAPVIPRAEGPKDPSRRSARHGR